jgi:hypothetical protein
VKEYLLTLNEVSSRWALGIFLFTTASRTALGPAQPPIQWVTGALSLGVKRPRHEADHSPPSSAEVPQYAFMVWFLIKAKGQLYLYLYEVSNGKIIINDEFSRTWNKQVMDYFNCGK